MHSLHSQAIHLINATQHDQSNQPWPDIGVHFDDPDFCPYTTFDPKRSTREQVVAAWRNLLAHLDRQLQSGEKVDGFLLGGYPPVVLGLYQFLSQFRQTSCVAVMGPAPIVDGQKRAFVLSGLRRIPTPRALKAQALFEGQPLEAEDPDVPAEQARFAIPKIDQNKIDPSRLIHVSARALTDARRAEVARVSPVALIASFPALPPNPDHSLDGFLAAVDDIARLACDNRCGILLDGPPAETLLHLYALLGHQLPFYFAKTEKIGNDLVLVAVEKVPRF